MEMAEVWRQAAARSFAIRRIIDARLALTLRHHGVTEFATSNEKDFAGFGFARVWNPLKGS
jgi:predicted nucleic acid-binding protein